MLITKADGTLEEFNHAKLMASLRRAGADDTTASSITRDVEKELFQGMTTSEIYRRAFARLRGQRRILAARYSLKRALLDFGPSGFPFESYVGEIFAAEGYEVQIDQNVQGHCVEHEVDVIAKKDAETLYVEAKFHNSPGYKTDLKVVLYVQARMEDIGKGRGLVVTNTKFTTHAVQYASCRGLELLGWEEPRGRSLQDRIERAMVYPITALTTLSNRQKTALLVERVVLCNDLQNKGDALARAGVPGGKVSGVLEEAAGLCVPGAGV